MQQNKKFELLSVGTQKPISFALITLYLVFRFLLIDKLDQIHEINAYLSYYFEVLFIALVFFFYRKSIQYNTSIKIWPNRKTIASGVAAGVLGFIISKAAVILNISIPFDFKDSETVLFLLVLGPILEELIFRFAIWELLFDLFSKPIRVLLISSALFSFAHFFAWWSVPEEIHSFILYQTIYTLGLGLYCGWKRIQTRSILIPILIHAFFNLGFYLAALT